MIIAPKFDYAWDFSEGFAAVRLGNHWGYITLGGNFVIQPKFDWAYEFSEGLAAVRSEWKWGYIDYRGEYVIPATV